MNEFYNMVYIQSNNEYKVFTPQGICIAHVVMPPNGQYIMDAKTVEIICKALAYRWGVVK